MPVTHYVITPAPAINSDAAHELRYRMQSICSAHLSCLWARDLEFLLWDMLEGGPRLLGWSEVPLGELEQLQRLHELAGGWWLFRDGDFLFQPTRCWETQVLRKRYLPRS